MKSVRDTYVSVPSIAVIDYGASNLQSVCNALERLEQSFEVVKSPEPLSSFAKVILPGVGAAAPAMERLIASGFGEALPQVKVPLLGICLGLQLLSDFSEEENTRCLSIIPGRVRRFPNGWKVPQIGWNSVDFVKKTPLGEGVLKGSYFYFVNSYYLDSPQDIILGETLYGLSFASVIQKGNFYGVQFHPEKSGEPGLRLLRNFCEKC